MAIASGCICSQEAPFEYMPYFIRPFAMEEIPLSRGEDATLVSLPHRHHDTYLSDAVQRSLAPRIPDVAMHSSGELEFMKHFEVCQ
jgi:hypothetical protein